MNEDMMKMSRKIFEGSTRLSAISSICVMIQFVRDEEKRSNGKPLKSKGWICCR